MKNHIGQMIIDELESIGKPRWVSARSLASDLNEKHVLKLSEEDVLKFAIDLDEVVVAPRGKYMSGENPNTLILAKYLSPEEIKEFRNPKTYRSHNVSEPNKFLDEGVYSHKIKGAIF